MIEINLIPDVKLEYLKARMMRNAVISVSIVGGVVMVGVAVVLGLIIAGQLVTQSVQDRTIKSEGDRLMAIEDIDRMVTIQQQLETIGGQYESRQIHSRLFDVISAINPPNPNNVVISTLKLNPEEKTISIEGSAVNGYVALEVFKKTIMNTSIQVQQDGGNVREALATDITGGDTSFGENAEGQRVLRFSFTFAYPEELFRVSGGTVSIVLPQGRVDVTDSRLGVPESLFGAKANDIKDEGGGR